MNEVFTGDSLRVLLVDDHALSRRYAREALRDHALAVKTASSAEAGLRIARDWQPDVIVLDRNLPDMDGLELARRVRTGPGRSGRAPRLILLSAEVPQPGDVPSDDGVVDILLTKPVAPDELLAAILQGKGRVAENDDMDPFRALCRAELRGSLQQLDECLMRADFAAACDLVHRMIAASAMGQERTLERALRRLQPALRAEQRDDIAGAYYSVLTAADGRLIRRSSEQ